MCVCVKSVYFVCRTLDTAAAPAFAVVAVAIAVVTPRSCNIATCVCKKDTPTAASNSRNRYCH